MQCGKVKKLEKEDQKFGSVVIAYKLEAVEVYFWIIVHDLDNDWTEIKILNKYRNYHYS